MVNFFGVVDKVDFLMNLCIDIFEIIYLDLVIKDVDLVDNDDCFVNVFSLMFFVLNWSGDD